MRVSPVVLPLFLLATPPPPPPPCFLCFCRKPGHGLAQRQTLRPHLHYGILGSRTISSHPFECWESHRFGGGGGGGSVGWPPAANNTAAVSNPRVSPLSGAWQTDPGCPSEGGASTPAQERGWKKKGLSVRGICCSPFSRRPPSGLT